MYCFIPVNVEKVDIFDSAPEKVFKDLVLSECGKVDLFLEGAVF